MLIFVILSTTTTTTAAYFSKLPQPQLRPHSYQQHSRAPLCRQSPPHTTTVLCSSPLPPCPSLKLRLRLPLRPLCRPRTSHPIIPSYPVFCPPSLPCPPSISCPLLCPQLPLSSPGPPSISPPQHYDNIRPSFAKPEPYLDGIFESYQSSYKGQLSDDNYLTHDTENITDLQHSSFPEKSTTNTTYHSSSSVTSNVTNSKSTILFPSDQQFNYPSDVYLSNTVHENASALSQQLPQIATTGEDRLTAGITQKYETKYLIKSNCSLNGTNCAVDDFFMPPEVLKCLSNLFILKFI